MSPLVLASSRCTMPWALSRAPRWWGWSSRRPAAWTQWGPVQPGVGWAAAPGGLVRHEDVSVPGGRTRRPEHGLGDGPAAARAAGGRVDVQPLPAGTPVGLGHGGGRRAHVPGADGVGGLGPGQAERLRASAASGRLDIRARRARARGAARPRPVDGTVVRRRRDLPGAAGVTGGGLVVTRGRDAASCAGVAGAALLIESVVLGRRAGAGARPAAVQPGRRGRKAARPARRRRRWPSGPG